MLRKSFAFIVLAFLIGFSHAEEKIATATSPETKEEPRRASETEFKKAPQIDPTIKVTKVHEFQNIDSTANIANNHALQFEKEYWNYGAVTQEELNNRKGHYFVISWSNKGPAANFTTRFEYRQSKSKDVVRTLTMEHTNIKGSARSTFAVLGDAYKVNGPVISWRFLILKGDQIVGEEHSFIW